MKLSERGLIALSHKLTQEEINALKNGYLEMAQLNSELAEDGLEADVKALLDCEEYLSGKCE